MFINHGTLPSSDFGSACRASELLPPRRRPRTNWALWIIAVSLAALAGHTLLRHDPIGAPPAFGQTVASGGARGTFAFSGQLTRNTYGIFMVDVDAMTLWCYEYTGGGKLRLAAAREFTYDRYLRAFNNEDPPPDEVQQMVEQERAARRQANENP